MMDVASGRQCWASLGVCGDRAPPPPPVLIIPVAPPPPPVTGQACPIFTRWCGVRACGAERHRDVLLWRSVSDLRRSDRRVHVYVRHREDR
jgi:hypothetical protein